MAPGDILVGIIGTIGSIGLVTDRFGKLTGNCKLAIISTLEIEPEYVAVYLSSKIGQDEIIRRTRGTVQMGLILPDIKDLPIPLLQPSKRKKISELVRKSYSKRQESIDSYKQAKMCFLQELGLEKFILPEELYFERKLSDVKSKRRLDSEYFKP